MDWVITCELNSAFSLHIMNFCLKVHVKTSIFNGQRTGFNLVASVAVSSTLFIDSTSACLGGDNTMQ